MAASNRSMAQRLSSGPRAATATGVNTSAALNASNPVYSGPDGGFSLNGTYSCPTGSGNDAQVYLTATGGNPGLTPAVRRLHQQPGAGADDRARDRGSALSSEQGERLPTSST